MKPNSAILCAAFLTATSAIGDRMNACYDCITIPLADAAYHIIWPQKIDGEHDRNVSGRDISFVGAHRLPDPI